MATASTSTETVSPAIGALMEKSWLRTGRIDWVVYMLAKIKAGARKSVTSAPRRGCSRGVLDDEMAIGSFLDTSFHIYSNTWINLASFGLSRQVRVRLLHHVEGNDDPVGAIIHSAPR